MGIEIRDGYTLQATMPAAPPIRGEVRYKYRPALLDKRNDWVHADSAAARTALARRIIVQHVVEVCEDGEPVAAWGVPQEREKIAEHLMPEVALHMVNSVLGYSVPDQVADAKN